MLQFLEAGLVAAGRQLVSVVIITVAINLLAPNRIAVHEGSVTGATPGLPTFRFRRFSHGCIS